MRPAAPSPPRRAPPPPPPPRRCRHPSSSSRSRDHLADLLLAARSILFQRGVYPPDQFSQVPKYGLTMLVTNDTGLQQYLSNVTKMIRSAWPTATKRPSPCPPSDARALLPARRQITSWRTCSRRWWSW